jgi:hypothetical protein
MAVIPTHVLERSFFKDKVITLGDKFEYKSSDFDFIFHTEAKDSLKIQTLFDFLHKEVNKLKV